MPWSFNQAACVNIERLPAGEHRMETKQKVKGDDKSFAREWSRGKQKSERGCKRTGFAANEREMEGTKDSPPPDDNDENCERTTVQPSFLPLLPAPTCRPPAPAARILCCL